jgi:hypothetical protein
MHRQKDKSPFPVGAPQLDDPEGKDIAGVVWLSISPSLAGKSVTRAVQSALLDTARDNKIPTAFYYGEKDTSARNLTKTYLSAIQSEKGKKIELKNTGEKAIPGTELTGSKLLGGGRLGTADYIVKYLNSVMEDRGNKEWKKREEEKSRYFWTVNGRPQKLAKNAGEKVIQPIPPSMLKLSP